MNLTFLTLLPILNVLFPPLYSVPWLLLMWSVDLMNYEFDRKDLLCLGGCFLVGIWYLIQRVSKLVQFLLLCLYIVGPSLNLVVVAINS